MVQAGLEMVFPPVCGLCRSAHGVTHDPKNVLCDACRTAWDAAAGMPACRRCGGTLAPYEASDGDCAACRRDPPRVRGTARVGAYQGCLADAIRRYKFHGQENLYALLADSLAAAVRRAEWSTSIEFVTFVPTHWHRQIGRPFHAAQRLARALAMRLDLPSDGLMRRTRAGVHQVGLSPTARQVNVRGAFDLVRGVELRGARLLLVDDVKTTGATLEECTRILRAARAGEVYAAVLARVEWTPATAYYLRQV